MKFFHLFKKEKLLGWVTKNAEGPQGTVALSTLSFSESLFFPIPPDVLLIAIISVRKVSRWFFYASVALVFSILGGVVGYIIGATFFDTFGQGIIDFYNLSEAFEKISIVFKEQTFLAILIAAITPIPFKIFTLAGGLFKVNFFVFLFAAIVGRAARFYAVAYLTKLYGPYLVKIFFKYFNTISLFLVILITLVLVFVL
ncbi:MAG: VTT domain-containing protein [Candidatus Paceibacterota bacterium]